MQVGTLTRPGRGGGGTLSVLNLGFMIFPMPTLKQKLKTQQKEDRPQASSLGFHQLILFAFNGFQSVHTTVYQAGSTTVYQGTDNSVPGYGQQRTRGYTAIKSQKTRHVAKRRTRPCTLLINQLGQLITAKRIRKIRSQLS